ncbi:hypothetical protein [Pleionea sp. CnH1-48]|uniref:hypothetical protein n=1 Tax=Pleionea sp. CnH1-48 TaxID=2954494 RepID=UPI002096A540|nr:hypothetical protein [Pleionea sp. CnH1-48]MCO7224124.1 hypothetical protein [Pleionea sp. CnH1-48]
MTNTFYKTPLSDIGRPTQKRVKLGKVLFIIGALLQLGIFYGTPAYIYSMYNAFQEITLNGNGDSQAMANMISSSLSHLVIGVIVAFPGLVLSSLALFISSYQNKFFKAYFLVASLFWILAFPVGTVFGLIFLIIVIVKGRRNEKEVEVLLDRG